LTALKALAFRGLAFRALSPSSESCGLSALVS